MDTDENDIEHFMFNPRGAQANRATHRPNQLLAHLKFILLKIPSFILCEYILSSSDIIYDEINSKFAKVLLSSYIVYFIYKFVLLLSILLCTLLFALSNKYVIRLYEAILLVSQPFLFTYLTEMAHNHTIILAGYFIVPHLFLTALIHFFIGFSTILIYSDLYTNVISDKFNIHQDYLANRERNRQAEPTIEDYIHNLYNRRDNELNPSPIVAQISKKKRIIFIALYTLLSFYVNELSSSSNQNINSEFIEGYELVKLIQKSGSNSATLEYFNIISLGYLSLLTYDLSFNLDQLLLRLVIKLRNLGNAITQYGVNNLLSFNWFVRLRVPFVLRVYFGLKLAYFTLNFLLYSEYYFNLNVKLQTQTYTENYSLFATIYSFFMPELNNTESLISDEKNSISAQNETFSSLLNEQTWPDVAIIYLKMLVLNLSETLVSIGATTSILSYQFYLIGHFLAKILSSNPQQRVDNNNNRIPNDLNNDFANVGDVAAILFFLLSIQSGLSSLDGNQRVEKFLKNYSLLFIAILHYFHTSLDAQLMNLSASSKPNWSSQRHMRLLGVCVALIFIPLVILSVLWYNFKISTWLLAASAFNLELIVKMSVSLIIYGIFVFDSYRASSAYEKLSKKNDGDQINELADNTDDYIYYIRAFGHIVEFFVALFLFFNGAYILFFESYGAVRAVMMCIHAYFHIWCQARKGWSVFIKRRTAIGKMKRLSVFNLESFSKLATKKRGNAGGELDLGDEFREACREPCAICFCELAAHEARITSCNHIFHFVCLRKWIYFQDTCPMCHQIVYQTPAGVQAASS